MNIILGIISILLGLGMLSSDFSADIKIFLGLLPVFCGIMLLLGFK